MTTQGFDAHTHLDFPLLNGVRQQVLSKAREAGVGGCLIAGADPREWDRAVAVATRYRCAIALGVHPWWTELPVQEIDKALSRLSRAEVDAIGEIGLDHHRARSDEGRAAQEALFRLQLRLANDRELPVLLHCVKAFEPMMTLIRAVGLPLAGGMLHGFNGSKQMARRALSIGLHLSIGPAALKSCKLRTVVAQLPIERLLLETDCPEQGAEPIQIVEIAKILAADRGCDTGALLSETGDNARRLFRYTLHHRGVL